MNKAAAFAGSALFFLLAPGTVAGIIPWLITRWRAPAFDGVDLGRGIAVAIGMPMIAYGLALLIEAFVRFAAEGLGTPAPIAPPTKLVVTGIYKRTRNPMYVALIALIIGQALVFASPLLGLYAGVVFFATYAFVTLYEEPTLKHRFGAEYERYMQDVPRWFPRLRRKPDGAGESR